MTDAAKFWDRIAEKYARDPIENMDGYLYTVERTRSYLNPSDKALELGCGTGTTALDLAGSVSHLLATDISSNMIKIAQDKAATEGTTNVSFAVGDVFSDANGQGPYDVVLAHNLLHLVPELKEALGRISGLLKPGGVFVSKTFCVDPGRMSAKIRVMKLILPLMRLVGKAPEVRFISTPELERMIEAAGFGIIETENYPAQGARRYIVARKI